MAISLRRGRTAIAAGAMALALAFSPMAPVAHAQTTQTIQLGTNVQLGLPDLINPQGALDRIVAASNIAVDAGTQATLVLPGQASQLVTGVTINSITDAAGNVVDTTATVTRNADRTLQLNTGDLTPGAYTFNATFTTAGENITAAVPVTVTDPDAISITTVTNDAFNITPGGEYALNFRNLPAGATVTVTGLDDGWTAVINDNGNITITAPEDAVVGETEAFTVTVADADGVELYNEELTATVVEVPTPGEISSDISSDLDIDGDLSDEAGSAALGSAALGSSVEGEAGVDTSSVDGITQQSSLNGSSIDGLSSNIGTNVETTGGSSSPQCFATALGFGLPVLALAPLALASQVNLPGLTALSSQVDQAIKNFNTQVQVGSSVFSPELARAAEQANAQLAGFGLNIGSALAGVAAVTYGLVAGSAILDACTPSVEGSSTQIAPGSSVDTDEATDETAEAGSSLNTLGETSSAAAGVDGSTGAGSSVAGEVDTPADTGTTGDAALEVDLTVETNN